MILICKVKALSNTIFNSKRKNNLKNSLILAEAEIDEGF